MSVKDCRNPENLNGIDDGLLKKTKRGGNRVHHVFKCFI